MEYLRSTIAQISQQLESLGRSQRIAIALCATVVAGSLMWLVQYSAAPEMVPILAQDLTLEQIDTAMTELESQGIRARQAGSRILVPPSQRDRALLALNRADALPQDTSLGFAELMEDSDPFRPSDENAWRRQVALGNELARIIASGDAIESARVIIQDKSKRRIGSFQNIKPTASVHVQLVAGKQVNQPMVDGLCRFVGGAVPGLQPFDVTVWDARANRAYSMPDPDDALGIGLLEEKKKNEKHLADKIRLALQSIPGALISVSVDLDANQTSTRTQAWSKPAVKEDESITFVNESADPGAETGVNPNVGVALTGGSTNSRNESEEARTNFYDSKPTKVEEIRKAPFTINRATASIGIPRSFLVGIYRARFGTEQDPARLEDDQNFQLIRKAELDRVRSLAMNILMTDSEDDVEVESFYDFAGPDGESGTFPSDGVAMASAASGVASTLRRYAMHGVLLALSLVSFFMMSRLVRKSSSLLDASLPKPAGAEVSGEEELHVAGARPVGKAATTDGLLVGQEIDEETLRFRQLGEQVSQMIDSNPESAADLIRRWTDNSK